MAKESYDQAIAALEKLLRFVLSLRLYLLNHTTFFSIKWGPKNIHTPHTYVDKKNVKICEYAEKT